jgi:RNA polymerase sigma-70 factor (ECF subfamily)
MEPFRHTSRLVQSALSMSRVPESDVSSEVAEATSLVRRTIAGDATAFEQLMLRHERRVVTLAMRLLGTLEDAQDAAQEIFLRAFKYIHRLDPERPVEPWLFRITVNVCRDIGRKKQKRRVTFCENTAPESLPADESEGPHTDLEEEQQRYMLRRALNNLPEKERMAVILRDVEGLSTSEVAAILKSSEGTVRSQICRGRLRLKELIDAMMGGAV